MEHSVDSAPAHPPRIVTAPSRTATVSARKIGRWGFGLLVVALVSVWVALFTPTALGGGASYIFVSGVSMNPTLVNGDFVVMRARRAYAKGDIVAYHVPKGQVGAGKLVIHRIIGGSPTAGFVVQGDNRRTSDTWRPHLVDIAGKLWFRVPGGAQAVLQMRLFLLIGLTGLLTWVTVMSMTKPGAPDDARSGEA
jgi:signal peptidase I